MKRGGVWSKLASRRRRTGRRHLGGKSRQFDKKQTQRIRSDRSGTAEPERRHCNTRSEASRSPWHAPSFPPQCNRGGDRATLGQKRLRGGCRGPAPDPPSAGQPKSTGDQEFRVAFALSVTYITASGLSRHQLCASSSANWSWLGCGGSFRSLEQHPFVRSDRTIPSSRPAYRQSAARSGSQGCRRERGGTGGAGAQRP